MTERRVELAAGVYHLQGGSNVGLIVAGGEALVIDAGLDADAAKAILRHAAELGATVRGVIITHAHADHFGGATELARRTGAGVYAAGLEGAIVGQPLLEPLYLYAGASPIQELRHKFTLAKAGVMTQPLALGSTRIAGFAVEIVSLAGHAPAQVGVRYGEALFTADAFFPAETLEKHGIPFCVDLDEALRSLDAIERTPAAWYAPGHGPALREPAAVIAANRRRLERIRELCLEALAQPAEVGAVVRHVAGSLGAALRDPLSYLLGQTTVLAGLASCQRAGLACAEVCDNRLVWRRN
jgi:glyoxylase-like metal-dependent hydrolase (beta-lactamase superfamily II)